MMNMLEHYIQKYQLPFDNTIISNLELKTYEAQQHIVRAGDNSVGFFLLVEGRYRVTTNEITGKSMLLRFCSPLSILGDLEWFQKTSIQSDVIAEQRCSFIFFSNSTYENYLKENSEFAQILLEELSYKLQTCTVSSRVNALASVEARFAAYLYTIHSQSKFGQQLLTTNPHEIASLIGTTPRHLNRVLKKLSEQQIITRHKDGLLVEDWTALDTITEGIRYE